MKQMLTALMLLGASPSAFALEVEQRIQVDRSQIQCRETFRRPPRCAYCYDYGNFDPLAQAYLPEVDGYKNLMTTANSCAEVNLILDGAGDPVKLLVTRVENRVLGPEMTMQYATVRLLEAPASLEFQGSKRLK